MKVSLEKIINDLKQSEENVEKYLRTQQLANVGNMVVGIAHKFNNILGGILGYAQLLQDELPENSQGYRKAAIIEGAAKKASKLILQLHLFSNQKHGQNMRPVDPRILVEEIVSIAASTLTPNVKVKKVFDHGPHNILADSQSMALVLLNILLNSRDAMPNGGELFIKTSFADVQDAKADSKHPGHHSYVAFEVTDTGCGIPEDQLGSIFEPFFSTKKNQAASGLGLTIASEVVESHQGKIEVDSEWGTGTSVRVFIPSVRRSRKAQDRLHPASAVPGEGQVIMVVDDEKELRDMAKIIFEQKGFRVLLADSGSSAIKLFDENAKDIQLVILDMVLPGPNGRQVYQRITAEKTKPKIILTSGYSKESADLEFVDKEDEFFIPKPWDLPELIDSVNQLLHSDE